MQTLEERIERLEDIQAIKDVTAKYSFFVNKGWNNKLVDVNAMPEIFTEDAVFKSKDLQTSANGLKEIMSELKTQTDAIDFSMHSYSNPVIEVKGDQATGNWLLWIISKTKTGSTNQVYMSEDICYLKLSSGWRIQAVNLYFGTLISH